MGRRESNHWEAALATLAARPQDPASLWAVCATAAREQRVEQALGLLRNHPHALAAIEPAALEQVLRAMAAADPARAAECHWVLARELLRFGEIEGARRALDDLPGEAGGRRFRELRASALFRGGDAAAALAEMDRALAGAGEDPADALALAEYAVARAELKGARRTLYALAPRTAERPSLEQRRAAALAMSYWLEERYLRAARWARRARLLAQAGGRQNPLLGLIEILALLGLDQIDRAALLAQRSAPRVEREDEVLGRGIRALYRAAIAWRRGDFRACLSDGERALERLESDQVARAVLAHYLGRAALGLGKLERAEALFRATAAQAAEPGTAILGGMAACDRALLAELRGDRRAARAELELARARTPASPFVAIERWALATKKRAPDLTRESKAVRAYAALRGAERAIELGDGAGAAALAGRAARWYRARGAGFEHARALLAGAEIALFEGQLDQAKERAAAAHALSDPAGYAQISARAALISARVADRRGDLTLYLESVARARSAAGPELGDRALEAAAARVGLDPEPSAPQGKRDARLSPLRPRGTVVRPASLELATFRPVVDRLGLARPRAWLSTCSGRAWLLAPDEEAPSRGLRLDLDRRELHYEGGELALTVQSAALLLALASAPAAGASLEALHLSLGGSDYHPLRNRNAIYVALNRLRALLKPIFERDPIAAAGDSAYRWDAEAIVTRRDVSEKSVDDDPQPPPDLALWREARAAARWRKTT